MSEEVAVRETIEIANQIFYVRGQRILVDTTLAGLYGVTTKRLNEQVRRNRERFPPDFLIELRPDEWESLRSQFVITRGGHGQHRKYPPLAFTEHGAIMAATILNSLRAIQMSVYVVRAFVRFRKSLATNAELGRDRQCPANFLAFEHRLLRVDEHPAQRAHHVEAG